MKGLLRISTMLSFSCGLLDNINVMRSLNCLEWADMRASDFEDPYGYGVVVLDSKGNLGWYISYKMVPRDQRTSPEFSRKDNHANNFFLGQRRFFCISAQLSPHILNMKPFIVSQSLSPILTYVTLKLFIENSYFLKRRQSLAKCYRLDLMIQSSACETSLLKAAQRCFKISPFKCGSQQTWLGSVELRCYFFVLYHNVLSRLLLLPPDLIVDSDNTTSFKIKRYYLLLVIDYFFISITQYFCISFSLFSYLFRSQEKILIHNQSQFLLPVCGCRVLIFVVQNLHAEHFLSLPFRSHFQLLDDGGFIV